jgi:hypothetical protein
MPAGVSGCSMRNAGTSIQLQMSTLAGADIPRLLRQAPRPDMMQARRDRSGKRLIRRVAVAARLYQVIAVV